MIEGSSKLKLRLSEEVHEGNYSNNGANSSQLKKAARKAGGRNKTRAGQLKHRVGGETRLRRLVRRSASPKVKHSRKQTSAREEAEKNEGTIKTELNLQEKSRR